MADRPALSDTETEITPEMIEAGVEEFVSYDSRVEMPEDCVAEIFRKMVNSAPKQVGR